MKYPRTFHLPFSPGGTSDDKKIQSVDSFLNKPIIITEKLDGSNCCLTSKEIFARTHASPAKHPSFNWIKQQHAGIKHLISGFEVFGENCFAVHSIAYSELPSFFCFRNKIKGSVGKLANRRRAKQGAKPTYGSFLR